MPRVFGPLHPAVVLVPLLSLLLGALSGATPAVQAADEPVKLRTERWYEQSRDGKKTGYQKVVWSPSTWEGRRTVRDTTTFISRTQRDMGGMKDLFETTITSDLERGEDGTMWWMRVREEEQGRIIERENRWTGKGYEISERIVGQAATKHFIALSEPVKVDAESFLAERARGGKLVAGQTFDLRVLDVAGRRARVERVEILLEESLEDENGEKIACFKVRQVDPKSRSEMLLWIDANGAFVRLRQGSTVIRRTNQTEAEAMPAKAAEYSIVVPAVPPLERIFNADRLQVEYRVQGDEFRKLPQIPTSPWSRVSEVSGDEESGYVLKIEMQRHDNREAKARIPLVAKRFARWLEPTALMQTHDPLVQQTVEDVVAEEHDARKAAHALARFVYLSLSKQSPSVAQADAVQILKDCKGDCSEHCLLFVTLCRAAGIPARRCSGYVCIGGNWGSHAWAEIWTGTWIGADPTTGEVGTAARYVFYGYPDEPDSFPGVVSSRLAGRLRIVTTRLEEGEASFDLSDAARHRIYDRENARYIHVLAGLEARDVPEGWTVSLSQSRMMGVRGPGFSAQVRVGADQGADIDSVAQSFGGKRTTFGGAPALVRKMGSRVLYLIFSRRRIVQLFSSSADPELLEKLEKTLAPSFAEPAMAWK